MTFAPGAESAHVNEIQEGMPVVMFAIGRHEAFQFFQIDRIAIIGFHAGKLRAGSACVKYVFRRCIGNHRTVGLEGAHPHGKPIAALSPRFQNIVQLFPVIDAFFFLNVAPIEAQIHVIQARIGLQVIARFQGVAILWRAHAVVNVVEIPPLMGIGKYGSVVLCVSQVVIEPGWSGLRVI